MLPTEDRTPQTWKPIKVSKKEKYFKRPLRRVIYPLYLRIINRKLDKKYSKITELEVDQWYWGHRGLEYQLLRSRLNKYAPIKGKKILIAGCGTGRDVYSWLPYSPREIVGVDYFDYTRAWSYIKTTAVTTKTQVNFVQQDLSSLGEIKDNSIDIVGSDAVFEHLTNLGEVLKEFHRVLKPGGVLYATYGPLWFSWGGDHISGSDKIEYGYNHLILEKKEYSHYLDKFGEYTHSEDDGRTWIENNLFSYLRPSEYVSLLEKHGFRKMYQGIILEPRGIDALERSSDINNVLLRDNPLFDLITTGMTVIYKKDK